MKVMLKKNKKTFSHSTICFLFYIIQLLLGIKKNDRKINLIILLGIEFERRYQIADIESH